MSGIFGISNLPVKSFEQTIAFYQNMVPKPIKTDFDRSKTWQCFPKYKTDLPKVHINKMFKWIHK